jgi:serine/threonine protein kinase/tetratricopeptide (TPR) repeat protein
VTTPRLISHYRVIETLGKGGMGEVFLAEDTKHHDRKVALKLLPADMTEDETRLRRFRQEARAILALNHPNILTIYEIGEEQSLYFIATEFIDGVTLRTHLARNHMETEKALDVAIQVAAALDAAHTAGIVHRDIKPENIMLRTDGYVKVLDFGLAKLSEKLTESETGHDPEAVTVPLSDTNPGAVIGTTGYMSPEQARGLMVDARTDIFSFGVVLYEMVAGRAPFGGETKNDIIVSLLNRDPLPLARFAPNAPPELQRIVTKALSKDKEERYQTVKDMLIDLRGLKRDLEFTTRLERSADPGFSGSGGTRLSGHSTFDPVHYSRTDETQPTRSTTSTGSVIEKVNRNRTVLALSLLALVLALGLGVLYFTKRGRTINSVAILPFVNGSHNPNTEYLSDGLTESIISSLSQLPNLKVMSRSAVFRYKGQNIDAQEVGRKLGVGAVLMGTVDQIGDSLVIKTELIDVSDGSQLWGEQYNRKISDLITVQQEIAWKISKRLRLRLTGEDEKRITKHYTENTEAYQLYLKGRYFWNKRDKESLNNGIRSFQDAIKIDPGYALAYSGMADSYALLADIGAVAPNEAMPRAKAAAERAIELDPELAEGYTSSGFVKLSYDWDWPAAERDFKRALELNPNYATAHQWYASYLLQMGRYDDATEEIKRAQQLDPLSLIINANKGYYLYFARQYDAAIEQYRKTLEIDPNFGVGRYYLAQAYVQKKMYGEAIAEFQKLISTPGDDLETAAALGYAYAQSGRRADAQKFLTEIIELSKSRYVSPLYIATIYTGLGERDQAIEWLYKAYDARHPGLVLLKVDPMFDSLRGDARFQELLRRFDRVP